MPLSYPNRSRRCSSRQLRYRRCGRRAAMTTAMAARAHTRTVGPWHHRRTARPAGAHAGRKWSAREDEHPFGTFGTARTVHAVVMAEEGLIMPGNCRAGEEDNRHHENRAGDNHHPRRSLIEPRRLRHMRRRRRRAGGRRRRELGLGCLGHPSIMPTRAPTIKHRARAVADTLSAQLSGLAPPTRPGPGRYRPSSTGTRRNAE
jgi:hypothetical protein